MSMDYLIEDDGAPSVPLTPVTPDSLATRAGALAGWAEASGYRGKPGAVLLLPGSEHSSVIGALVGVEGNEDIWSWSGAVQALPPGNYRIEGKLPADTANRAALGWALGSYAFTRYKQNNRPARNLVWPHGADRTYVAAAAGATSLARDLINTPAADMGPADLAEAARELAGEFGADFTVTVGDELLERNYPAIHAVGRAAAVAPRLIDISWGDPGHPKVTLVGKGVCFDTGGLDLKPSRGMALMKKDMGGAAAVLGLARMIMMTGLPVRLRVLVPAVENSVSGNAMRPRDILQTRKGLTVEVGNTDAEGRLVLADALTEAMSDKPDLVLDFATLTGAARAAVGTGLGAMFTPDDRLAEDLYRHGVAEDDPVWRLPLWKPYRRMLDSKVADINNITDSPYAGAITAALFLAEFVDDGVSWAHLDIMAWNPAARPGRPEGGEAMAMRAAFATIKERYAGG
ncbi:MAG: leucyl aminopeptidase family protein [Proteobacteria bacterium]|nr:leucyl aminopeptidase family protein [Pseudomonadota bacterium]